MSAGNTRSSQYSIPETISTSANASVDAAVRVQLVKNTELDNELDGIESCFGMCWGELRKWVHHPMNYINLQPDLVELLRRKDVLISPTPALMAQIRALIKYNTGHPQEEVHFLKRFPQGVYEYTIIPTTRKVSIYSQHEDTSQNVEHLPPYHDTLIFKSQAHPCFMLSFTTLDILAKWLRTPLINSTSFPIEMCATYESLLQPSYFYRRPYLGWIPRTIPALYLDRPNTSAPRNRSNVFPFSDDSSSDDLVPPRKRYKRPSASQPVAEDGRMSAVDNWRYTVVPSSTTISMADDEALNSL